MIVEMLDLQLFRKLAEMVLARDQIQAKFLLTEKGTLKIEMDKRLRLQLNERISQILQAINNYSLSGITETWRANQEREAILIHIREEMTYLEGIECVYRALLNRQTMTALDN